VLTDRIDVSSDPNASSVVDIESFSLCIDTLAPSLSSLVGADLTKDIGSTMGLMSNKMNPSHS